MGKAEDTSPGAPRLYTIAPNDDGVRLDRAVQEALGISRRKARLLISEGRVLVGGRSCRILTRPLRAGTKIAMPPSRKSSAGSFGSKERTAPALQLLALDRYWAVVNKPAGLLSEPDRFGSPSVLSELATQLARLDTHTRLWLVHRLDAGTSGVLVLARTPGAAAHLSEQFAARRVKKQYLALCQGTLHPVHQHVDAPIERVAGTRHAVVEGGKPAKTGFVQVWCSPGSAPLALVVAAPKTGRTHQIRVHLMHLGAPIVGDRLYGGPSWLVDRHGRRLPLTRPLLHAARLQLRHPHTQDSVELRAPAPADLCEALVLLGARTNALPQLIDMHYKARPCPKPAPPA